MRASRRSIAGSCSRDGVYEVVPVHRGRPFRLRQHLERLERSLAEVRIRNPLHAQRLGRGHALG